MRASRPVDLETIFTGQENFDLFPQAKLHTRWPGGPGVKGNPAFDQFYLSQVPFIASALRSEELVDPALIALLEKIGPSVLLTHSQAGVFGWAVSDKRPELVKAHVAVEPNGPTFYDIRFKGGADWYEKVGEAPRPALRHHPRPADLRPAGRSRRTISWCAVRRAPRPGQIRCWLQAEPARKLPNLARVPAVIVTAEASFRATMDDCTGAFLEQAGAKPDRLALAEHGIHGNGHMMMLETNNGAVADAIIEWIAGRCDDGRSLPERRLVEAPQLARVQPVPVGAEHVEGGEPDPQMLGRPPARRRRWPRPAA